MYIVVAIIVVIILGLIFFYKDGTKNEIITESTSTPANTVTKQTKDSDSTQKTTAVQSNVNTTKSAPVQSPVEKSIPSIPTASDLNGSIFKMTSYKGNPVPLDSKYLLSFENGSLNAKFCNSMSGNFVLDGSLIKASNLLSTMMYCSMPSNLMEIESAFTSMLNFGAQIYQTGNTLLLSNSTGTVIVFTEF